MTNGSGASCESFEQEDLIISQISRDNDISLAADNSNHSLDSSKQEPRLCAATCDFYPGSTKSSIKPYVSFNHVMGFLIQNLTSQVWVCGSELDADCDRDSELSLLVTERLLKDLTPKLLCLPSLRSLYPTVSALSSTETSNEPAASEGKQVPLFSKTDEVLSASSNGSSVTPHLCPSAQLTSYHPTTPEQVATLTALSQTQQMSLYNPLHQREGEFICGWGAAFINICVTFPINKAIFRQQLHGITGVRAIRQLHKDGLRFLYRGLLPPLMQKTMSSSLMFGMYFRCQDLLREHFPHMGVVPNHALAAVISGTMEATLMPFERIQTLMQNRQFHDRFANTFEAFKHVRNYGITEYYRGLSLIIWRNGPSNVAFFLGREYLQTIGPHTDSPRNKMLKDFFSGACLGALISTVFFPLNVVKTRMQASLGGPSVSAWSTLKILLEERKGRYRELFRGVHLNYTRSFISWGIINASFEFLIKLYNGGAMNKGSASRT